jgi:hypothetical protein
VHHSGQVRSQFTSGLFREYCASAGIKICFASVAYCLLRYS